MIVYKPDPAPEAGPGWYVSDDAPVPRHEFTKANGLYAFAFDEDDIVVLHCPDCGVPCEPANLGELVDWALSHKCAEATVSGAAPLADLRGPARYQPPAETP